MVYQRPASSRLIGIHDFLSSAIIAGRLPLPGTYRQPARLLERLRGSRRQTMMKHFCRRHFSCRRRHFLPPHGAAARKMPAMPRYHWPRSQANAEHIHREIDISAYSVLPRITKPMPRHFKRLRYRRRPQASSAFLHSPREYNAPTC